MDKEYYIVHENSYTTQKVFGAIVKGKFFPKRKRFNPKLRRIYLFDSYQIFENRVEALEEIKNKLIWHINYNRQRFGNSHPSLRKKRRTLSQVKRLINKLI